MGRHLVYVFTKTLAEQARYMRSVSLVLRIPQSSGVRKGKEGPIVIVEGFADGPECAGECPPLQRERWS